MVMFRSRGEQIVDRAMSAVAGAEMVLEHSFTPQDRSGAYDQLQSARRFLARAEATLAAWNAAEHDDYEEYPDVSETDQYSMY